MLGFNDGRDWFLSRHYGMFIHWGIYSVGGRSEWERKKYDVPKEEYDKYIPRFRAEHFDPARWLDTAMGAGMEYMVFTAKHHDGFCMWDTRYTDYNVMRTPFGKDPLRMLADECHRRDFPLVIYYSCMDWAHEAYPNDGTCSSVITEPAKHDMPKYMEYVKNQIRELCTEYGPVHGIWWDNNNRNWADPSVNALIRQLQPAAVINDRGFSPDGDFRTPERSALNGNSGFTMPTEACDSISCSSWCCLRDGDFHSARYCMGAIVSYIARDANFLLNVAPEADGRLQKEYLAVLDRVTPWFERVREALYAPCRPWVVYNSDIICTGSGNVLYFFLMTPPVGSKINLIPLDTPPLSAELLNTGAELAAEFRGVSPNKEPVVILRHYPADELHGEIPVIKLTFKESIDAVIAKASAHYYTW